MKHTLIQLFTMFLLGISITACSITNNVQHVTHTAKLDARDHVTSDFQQTFTLKQIENDLVFVIDIKNISGDDLTIKKNIIPFGLLDDNRKEIRDNIIIPFYFPGFEPEPLTLTLKNDDRHQYVIYINKDYDLLAGTHQYEIYYLNIKQYTSMGTIGSTEDPIGKIDFTWKQDNGRKGSLSNVKFGDVNFDIE